MRKVTYLINNIDTSVEVDESIEVKPGADALLSQLNTDISSEQKWYERGYSEENFLEDEEFENLLQGLTKSIKNIIEEELDIEIADFELEKYHYYVKTDQDHLKIASRTRDLFSEDFNFPILTLLPRLGSLLGFDLTDIDPMNKKKAHIIVRINRPQSNDFNPPHKDIYEGVDNDQYIPQFINFWIPIAGVTMNSSLPLAPSSHLINEKDIVRTFSGASVSGNKYRVRLIESWNGNSSLIRSTVQYKQALVFSSHLIHGLAVNNEKNVTRVALEFRLFKA